MTKLKIKYILLGIAVFLLLLIGFLGGRGYQKRIIPESEKYLKTEIESLQREVDSYRSRCSFLEESKAILEDRIGKFESTIRDIRRSYDEKVVDITTYTNPELEQFFSDRYGN